MKNSTSERNQEKYLAPSLSTNKYKYISEIEKNKDFYINQTYNDSQNGDSLSQFSIKEERKIQLKKKKDSLLFLKSQMKTEGKKFNEVITTQQKTSEGIIKLPNIKNSQECSIVLDQSVEKKRVKSIMGDQKMNYFVPMGKMKKNSLDSLIQVSPYLYYRLGSYQNYKYQQIQVEQADEKKQFLKLRHQSLSPWHKQIPQSISLKIKQQILKIVDDKKAENSKIGLESDAQANRMI